MALENKIEELTKTIHELNLSLNKVLGTTMTAVQHIVPVSTPVAVPVAAPVVPTTPTIAQATPETSWAGLGVPFPEVQSTPVAVTAAVTQLPFSDQAGLTNYIREAAASLGNNISQLADLLKELNVKSVLELTPEMYPLFYQKVEALKSK